MTAANIGSTLLHGSDHHDADPGHQAIAELLARIGLHLGCQRVELFGTSATAGTHLLAWWGTLGHEAGPSAGAASPDPGWFPWSLGNLRPHHHLFVENAAMLPSEPGGPDLGDLGFGSALYLPVSDEADGRSGALCAYWTRDGGHWDPSSAGPVVDWISGTLTAAVP